MLLSISCFRGFPIFSICFRLFLIGVGLTAAINTQAQTRAYVARPIGFITVIDTDTNTVLTPIPVCSDDTCSPTIPAVTPDGARIYVTNNLQDTVTVINTLTNTVIDTITVGQSPWGIAITPDGTRAYVASRSGAISVIDTSTNTVITSIADSAGPLNVAITPDGSRAYVSNLLGSISVVDISTNTIITSFPILHFALPGFLQPAFNLFAIVLTPDGTRGYVASHSTGDTYVFSTISNSMTGTIPTGQGSPLSIAISPNGTRVYTANIDFDAFVQVIDTATNTIIGKIPAAGPPPFVGVTPDSTRLYINALGTTTVVDTSNNSIVTTILTGNSLAGIAFGTLPPVPHAKDDCKNGGFQRFTVLGFPNQGQCLKYVKEHAN